MSSNESSLKHQESNKQSHPLASSDNQGAVAAGRTSVWRFVCVCVRVWVPGPDPM